MAPKQLTDGYHLSLSIGKALWDDLVGAALPLTVQQGEFDLGPMVYQGVRQLQVKEKVVALLEDRQPPQVVSRARERAADIWGRRREQVYKVIQDIVTVEGDWKLEIDDKGTEFHYAHQKIGVDAHVKATVNGKARLLKNNVEFPFTIEKRLGATCFLGEIEYDQATRAVVGSVQEPAVDLGEHVVLRLLNKAAALLIEQQRGFAKSLIGREMDVLLEKPGRQPGQRVGRSPWLQPVIVDEKAGEIGDIVSVRITEAGPNSLFAEPVL